MTALCYLPPSLYNISLSWLAFHSFIKIALKEATEQLKGRCAAKFSSNQGGIHGHYKTKKTEQGDGFSKEHFRRRAYESCRAC